MHCSACNTSSPPQARFCIFCGAPIAATGLTERLAWGSADPYQGTVDPRYHIGTIMRQGVPAALLVGSVVVNVSDAAHYGSASFYGTQAPKPSNMLYFGGQWYKVVPE